MNEKDQEKIDLLFTGYLDGELSERQQTELKRLLQTYPSLGEELKALRRQKDLLGALPAASAPATLMVDVQAALERNMILQTADERESKRLNTCFLFARRMVSAAAMLLIPVGLLGLLIFQIMRPVEMDPAGPGPVGWENNAGALQDPAAPSGSTDVAVAANVQENAGRLVLVTDQPILVNRYVEKRIHLHDLLNETVPAREADKTVYEIECSPERLARFIDDLPDVWRRCTNAAYTLGGESDEPLVVDHIQPNQLKVLMMEVNSDNKRRSASHFARVNQQAGDFVPPPVTVEEMMPLQPVRAGEWEDQAGSEADKAAEQEGPKVRFTLEVQSEAGESD